jgi:hypothetical protein
MTFRDALKATGRGVGSALTTTAAVINAVAEENKAIEDLASELMRKTPGLELTQAKLVAKMMLREVKEITWR